MRKDPNALAGIYRITRLSDGKVYVGQARKCSERWTMHRHSLKNGKHSNSLLQEAWNASSPEDWTWEIVCRPIGPHDPETMTYLEIEVLKNHPDSFNLMVPIQAYLGASPSTRAKLSLERRARWDDPAYRERVKASHAKRRADPDYQARHAASMRAFHATEGSTEIKKAGGKKASQAWKERPEMREAERERRKNLWKDPEYRARMTAARKAAWADPEKKKRRVEALKKSWENATPEERAARVQKAAEGQRRAEVRKAQSERTQKRWDENRGPRPKKG